VKLTLSMTLPDFSREKNFQVVALSAKEARIIFNRVQRFAEEQITAFTPEKGK
jgi:hypothetical protein